MPATSSRERSIGTLFAFFGLRGRRNAEPPADLLRGFTVPALPVGSVSDRGAARDLRAGWTNVARLLAWLAIGMVLYFIYGIRHSKLTTHNGARLPGHAEALDPLRSSVWTGWRPWRWSSGVIRGTLGYVGSRM